MGVQRAINAYRPSCIGLLACALLSACGGDPVVSGQVVDPYGNPVSNAVVRVDSTTLSAQTDTHGKYNIPYVPGTFRLVFEKAQHRSYTLPLSISEKVAVPAKTVTLYPSPKEKGIYLLNPFGGDPIALSSSKVHRYVKPIDRDGSLFLFTLETARKTIEISLPAGDIL